MKKISMISIFCITLLLSLCNACYAQYTKLYEFDSINGRFPQSDLFSDGVFLYGTTTSGGAFNNGIIFKIKADGTAYTKLFDFNGSNGHAPQYGLISDGTFLYGMTYSGGLHNEGVIFKIKPDGTGFVKLFDFDNTTSGRYPQGSLYYNGTYLFAMALGGAYNHGTIVRIKTDGTAYLKLSDFHNYADGCTPFGTFISDGTFLYGTTNTGGSYQHGVVFKIKPDGTGYVNIHNFDSINGGGQQGKMIYDGNFLYGTTAVDGINDEGTLFKLKPDGTAFSKLHDFDLQAGTGGSFPDNNIVMTGGFLYGTTFIGGANHGGVIFRIDTNGSNYLKLLDFDYFILGYEPLNCGVTTDGTALYGMTGVGGTYGDGVIYKYDLMTAGIAENEQEQGFQLYPNPCNGKFNLLINAAAGADVKISVSDLLGKEVYAVLKHDPQTAVEIDLSGVSKGMYVVKTDDGKKQVTKKLIVR